MVNHDTKMTEKEILQSVSMATGLTVTQSVTMVNGLKYNTSYPYLRTPDAINVPRMFPTEPHEPQIPNISPRLEMDGNTFSLNHKLFSDKLIS